MSRLWRGFHPTFEALSAHADLSDVDGARTRVGRHVAECASCRETVAEIRALGEAARARELPAAPAMSRGLWERIEGAARREVARERLTPVATPTELAPRHSRRRLAVTILAAATVATAVLWPKRPALHALGTSRLTFTPARPIPGGMLTVRYQPAPWFRDASRLVLVGRYARPADEAAREPWAFDDLGDSLASLTRTADGQFEARVRLPENFLALHLGVADSAGSHRDSDGSRMWMVIGGRADRTPSLPSFLAALQETSRILNPEVVSPRRQMVDVADSLVRYFPDHPAGWAATSRYGMRKGIFDLIRFFQGGERKYASMDAKLWHTRDLDAERIHGMATFASRISEPDEALKWAKRFAREHPEDPRALHDLARALHELELRMAPSYEDSVRRWLPTLDTLYRASRPSLSANSDALGLLVNRYADSATKVEWALRAVPGQYPRYLFDTARTSTSLEDRLESQAKSTATATCVLPSGTFPVGISSMEWRRWCTIRRALAWSHLSRLALQRNDVVSGVTFADSAVAMGRSRCAAKPAYGVRARARLAAGDSSGAAHDFAVDDGQSARWPEARENARAALGARFDAVRYDAIVDSTSGAVRRCLDAESAASRARSSVTSSP